MYDGETLFTAPIYDITNIVDRVGGGDSFNGGLIYGLLTYGDDIEKAFRARVFTTYGHGEKCICAAQCEHTKNYHVWPTYGYFELLDEDGNEVKGVGQVGEIVGTGFINTTVPFIRYRTGDRATYVSDHCEECGREHVTIRDINGRGRQVGLIAADGSAMSI